MRRGLGRRLAQERRGAIGVEVALLALPMTLLMFGAIEVGMTLKTRAALQYGAELAARCAAVTPLTCSTGAQVQAYVAPRLSGMTLPSGAFTLASSTCGKLVTASMAYNGAASHVLRTPVTLSARSCFPV